MQGPRLTERSSQHPRSTERPGSGWRSRADRQELTPSVDREHKAAEASPTGRAYPERLRGGVSVVTLLRGWPWAVRT